MTQSFKNVGRSHGRAGRQPTFDAAALVEVERIAQENPTASLGELVDWIEAATGIRSSTATLRKRLSELGFVRVLPPRNPKAGTTSTAAVREMAPDTPAPVPYVYKDVSARWTASGRAGGEVAWC